MLPLDDYISEVTTGISSVFSDIQVKDHCGPMATVDRSPLLSLPYFTGNSNRARKLYKNIAMLFLSFVPGLFFAGVSIADCLQGIHA